MELAGKTALVTGAGKRLGKAIALALANAGMDVAVHYGRSAADAQATAEEITRMGHRAAIFGADLAEPSSIEAMFSLLAHTFPMLHVLVNAAGVYDRTPIDTLTAEQWDSQLDVNARAAALCIRHALPLMTEGGAIVNITDIAATKAFAGYPAYCASKGALESLTKSTAKALAARNIRVNAVAPGVAIWQENASEAYQRNVLAQIPMGRAGSAEGIAAAVIFLARQDYITGQSLRVDGGWHMG